MSKTNKKLGKGLSALISGDDLEKTLNSPVGKKTLLSKIKSTIEQLDVNKIYPNPDQPRHIFEKEKLEELSQSIKKVGLIEPIIVTQTQEKYYLIAGERRWRAAKLASFSTIPAIIKNDTQGNILELMLIENIQRENLLPLEEANSYQIILDRKKITQETLANFIGKSRTYITNLLRILKLPDEVKQAINDKTISVGHAKSMIGFNIKEQLNILEKIKKQNLSVRNIEQLSKEKGISTINEKKDNKTSLSDPHIEELENKLRDHFKTKVSIKLLKKKSGKIEINFYDYDELEDVFKKMHIQ